MLATTVCAIASPHTVPSAHSAAVTGHHESHTAHLSEEYVAFQQTKPLEAPGPRIPSDTVPGTVKDTGYSKALVPIQSFPGLQLTYTHSCLLLGISEVAQMLDVSGLLDQTLITMGETVDP